MTFHITKVILRDEQTIATIMSKVSYSSTWLTPNLRRDVRRRWSEANEKYKIAHRPSVFDAWIGSSSSDSAGSASNKGVDDKHVDKGKEPASISGSDAEDDEVPVREVVMHDEGSISTPSYVSRKQ